MIKNTASQVVGAQMVSASDGSAFTGSVTVAVTVDGGTQATGSVGSGACTHEGNGYHTYAPAQAETNGDLVAFTFTGTGAIPVTVQVYTRGGDAFTRLGAPAGASVSADIASIKAETASILTDTAEIGAAGAGLTALATASQATAIEADTQDIQSRLPAALVGGRIDATVDATGMEAGAVAAIADGVWDEALSGHVTAGSAGDYLGDVSDLTTAAATIADAVWDEAQSGHVGAGTFGEIATEVAAILVDTAEIGAAGAGLTEAGGTGDHLTAVPWNASWDAEVQSEVQDAIEVNHLDHLLAVDYDPASKPGTSTALLNELVESDAGVSRFTANALEQAPSAGGGTDWTADERTAIRSILGVPASGTTPDDPTTGVLDTIRDLVVVVDGVADAILVDTADMQPKLGTPAGASVSADIAAVKAETAAILTDTAEIGAAGAGLTALATSAELAKVPKSDGTATWNATAAAQIQSEAADALAAYDPPTRAEATSDTNSVLAVLGTPAIGDLASDIADVRAGVDSVETDTIDIQSRLPAALVGGRIDATVDATGMEAGAIDGILDETIGDGTLTMRQALRVLVAGMAGKVSGAATTTITIRNVADSADVIVATVDADGNRSAVTVTP